MGSSSMQDALKAAIERLSSPFDTADDVRTVSMTLDGIAGRLLQTPYVAKRFGPNLTAELSESGAELPDVLRSFGGEPSGRAASLAADLLALAKSSLVDFGSDIEDEELASANRGREQLRDALRDLLGTVAE